MTPQTALATRPVEDDETALLGADRNEFQDAVIEGLSGDRKTLPSKFLYDEEGSRIFERICEVEAYYPTRTEMRILAQAAPDIAARAGPGAVLVEFGAGASAKIRLLLDALEAPRAYVPMDISGDHLIAANEALGVDYPNVEIVPVVADFTRPLSLPALARGAASLLGFFPGSTIGNFTPEGAEAFLRHAGETLGAGAGLVIGVDRKKDAALLDAAYDDPEGVTAAFNLNLLTRMNRELGADFDRQAFRHRAYWVPDRGRVEMHLESLADQTVRIDGHSFSFAEGETIHTENSYKYAPEEFLDLASRAGWREAATWSDPDGLFAVYHLVLG